MLSLEQRLYISIILFIVVIVTAIFKLFETFSNEMFILLLIGIFGSSYRGWQIFQLNKIRKEYEE